MEKIEYFILSYGTGQELIPVGCYYTYESQALRKDEQVKQDSSTKMGKIYAAYNNDDALFFNMFDLINNSFSGDPIMSLPADFCTETFSNCISFKDLGFSESVTPYIVFKTLVEKYSSDPESMPHIAGIPMDMLNAKWCTDEDLGYNYSIVPVKVKK